MKMGANLSTKRATRIYSNPQDPDRALKTLAEPESLPNQSKYAAWMLFGLSYPIFIVYLLSTESGWLFSGEMWAEMATNYFDKATTGNILSNLLATDAGYLVVPQRVLALIPTLFHLPSTSFPYVYSAIAATVSWFLAAVFVTPAFRDLIRSDYLRLTMALAALMMADFETRTFINFFYYGAFFLAVAGALLSVRLSKKDSFPKFVWIMPILMLAKPGLMASLPYFATSIFKRNRNAIWLILIGCLMGCVQLLMLIKSASQGFSLGPTTNFTIVEKTLSVLKYFFGLLGSGVLGPAWKLAEPIAICVGLLFVVASLAVAVSKSSKSGPMISSALSLALFTCVINSFTLPWDWNVLESGKIQNFPIYRHDLAIGFSLILLTGGIISTLSERLEKSRSFVGRWRRRETAVVIFTLWLVLSGWLTQMSINAQAPSTPLLGNSRWQQLAPLLETSTPVCIPLDPTGWTFGRGCQALNETLPLVGYEEPATETAQINGLTATTRELLAFDVRIKRPVGGNEHLFVTATVIDSAGQTRTYDSESNTSTGYSNVYFRLVGFPTESRVEKVSLHFSEPVNIGLTGLETGEKNFAITWYGVK